MLVNKVSKCPNKRLILDEEKRSLSYKSLKVNSGVIAA